MPATAGPTCSLCLRTPSCHCGAREPTSASPLETPPPPTLLTGVTPTPAAARQVHPSLQLLSKATSCPSSSCLRQPRQRAYLPLHLTHPMPVEGLIANLRE